MTARECQFSLPLERPSKTESELHASEPSAGKVADLLKVGGAKARDFSILTEVVDLLHEVRLGAHGAGIRPGLRPDRLRANS